LGPERPYERAFEEKARRASLPVPAGGPEPRTMSASAEKARALRLERLKAMVEARLENPLAALEALLSEIRTGEAQTGLWEALHGASLRDGKEADLASAYQKITQERRLQQFERWAQIEILMHAADFFQGVMGDGAAAESFLERSAPADRILRAGRQRLAEQRR
jgi:hypothetical protein